MKNALEKQNEEREERRASKRAGGLFQTFRTSDNLAEQKSPAAVSTADGNTKDDGNKGA